MKHILFFFAIIFLAATNIAHCMEQSGIIYVAPFNPPITRLAVTLQSMTAGSLKEQLQKEHIKKYDVHIFALKGSSQLCLLHNNESILPYIQQQNNLLFTSLFYKISQLEREPAGR